MKNSKSAKIFNVATSLVEYNDQISQNIHNRLKVHHNLFDQETPQKNPLVTFDKNRTYDYVGVKQLKAYYQRSRRISKDKRRDTIPLSLGLSRNSVRSNKDDELYSKWQIIQRVEKKLNQSVDQYFTYDENTMALDLTLRQDTSVPSNSINHSKRMATKPNEPSSSIIKIKNKYKTYKQNWQKQQKKLQFSKGFPSLLRLATQSRSVSIKKEIDQQKFKRENINERMWKTVLREQKQLKSIYDKQIPKLIENEGKLSINGKNKLALQKQWINNKGDQGHRFQLIKRHISKA